MKRILCFLITLTILISCSSVGLFTVMAANIPDTSDARDIDVWLIAGQSNAMGYAEWKNYPTDPEYAEYKTMLEAGSSNVYYMGTTDTAFTNTKASATRTGAEVGIATSFMNEDSLHAIIKVAWGNTSLYNNTSSEQSKTYGTWTPPSYIKNHNISTDGNKVGDLYLTFMKKIAHGIKDLEAKGYNPVIKGIWYMQGEADTFSATPANAYEELLETLISDMRTDISEISGMDCSELPFVYGRILRNQGIDPDTGAPYMDKTPYVPKVQEAQDAVNAKNIKNVFMVNTTTDLKDPVTGLHREPFQQDGWHYDSISQQMMGEKFVETVNSVVDLKTKYGFIPANNAALPLAVFKLDENGKTYTYDGSFETIKLALERARTLTLASNPLTKEAVVVVTKDFAHNNYPSNMSDVGGTITIDLNGYTLAPTITLLRTDVDDCLASGETTQKKAIVNIKNGKLKVGNYGIIYNTSGSTYTKVKNYELNIENVELSFFEDYSSKTSNFNDLIVTDRNYTSSLNVEFDINLNNCTLDLSTNAKSDASFGGLNTNNPATDKCTSNYDISFKNCKFIARNIDNISAKMSTSGDLVTFLKGEDGTYGKVYLPEGSYDKAFNGNDAQLKLKSTGETSGQSTIYNLVPSEDVTTAYGVIPADYADSSAYPLILFKKGRNEENYSFVSGYNVWKTALSNATKYIKGADGVTKDDEAVILLRRDFNFSDLYTSSAIGGTLTFDLDGHTLSYGMALMNMGNADFGTGKGGTAYINVKNGNMVCNTAYGMFYSQVSASNYSVKRGYEINFDNVNISYGKNGTTTSLLMHLSIANNFTSTSPEFSYNMIFNNCIVDMKGAPKDAYIAKLDKNVGSADTYNKINNKVIFKGGKIIGEDESDIVFSVSESDDSVNFDKDSSGNYTKIMLDSDANFPSNLTFYNSDAKILVCDNPSEEKLTTTYTLLETTRILTPYGEISAGYSDEDAYPFAIFKKISGVYQFDKGYGTYKEAMNAAINLTKTSLASPCEEAVVYLRRDWQGTGYPSGTSSVKTKITLDLNGKTLGAFESLCNTATGDSRDYQTSIIPTNAVIDVKNGKLLSKIHGFLYIAKSGSYTAGSTKTLTFNFSNVDFGFAEGATSVSLIGRVASNHTTEYATFNLNFDSCTFDMVTNRPSREDLVLANWTLASDYTKVYQKFTDCEFIGNNEADFAGTLGSNDASIYAKNKRDYYTLLTLPETALVPTGKYNLNDAVGFFEEIVNNGNTVTYGLFAKKANIDSVSVTKYTDYKNSTEYKTTPIDKLILEDGVLSASSGVAIDYASSGNVTNYGLDSEKNKDQYWMIALDNVYELSSINLNYGFTNKWVDFNVQISEDNSNWIDLGTKRPAVAKSNGDYVFIPLDSVRAKYIKLKVIKRNGTNAASSSSTAWGAGLGAGCTVTMYELSFCYSGICEATGSSEVVTAFNKVFASTDTFIHEDGKEYTAPVGIVFARAGENLAGLERAEYGVMLSLKEISKEEFATDSEVFTAPGKRISEGGQFGIRFFGSKIKVGETYYALPYAVYEDADGERVTVYAENVLTFTPEE